MPVHRMEGCDQGFLVIRSEEGKVIATGNHVQVTHGDLVTSRTVFHFKDGSLDDDTTIFSQRRIFHLISDHHVQKGPFFPHPIDLIIDAGKGQVTLRTTGKDGKDELKSDHMDLPPDLANGMITQVMQNLLPGTGGATVSMLVLTPKPRIVKIVISHVGDSPFTVAGTSIQGVHFEIKIDLGGAAAIVAPMIGKAPPNIETWIVGGLAPTFLREVGPIYADGPSVAIELASPAWGG